MNAPSLIERLLRRPYFIYSLLALFLFLGAVGYEKLERKLFPDSNYPEIAVVVVVPGASAKNIATGVAVPVEQELYTLDDIRRVYSTTIDEVTVIRAEFEYRKDIDDALNDASAAFSKIRSRLALPIQDPQFHKITEATAPVVTYAVTAKEGALSLEEVRRLTQTRLKPRLLKLPGISNVDIFGGHEQRVEIVLDKAKLESYRIGVERVLAALQRNDADFAVGFVQNLENRYLLQSYGTKNSLRELEALPLAADLLLGDIADVSYGHGDDTALYYGNGAAAIALSIQRNEEADVLAAIGSVEEEMRRIADEFPGLAFSVTDTQKETIVQSTDNMFESLRDAIILSTLVVFLFLGSLRQILVVMATIPLVYATTMALMWLVGIELNVVTLTAIILALGLLLDDAVVVMENIERHFTEHTGTIDDAVMKGTREIMFADLSGTLTTMIALFPMLFVGGYPQTVFQPLVGTLLLALAASYLISITAVPLLSMKILAIEHPYLLRSETLFKGWILRFNDRVQRFFSVAVRRAVASKAATAAYAGVLLLLFFISVRGVMPTVGQELMPPMDTGALKIDAIVEPNRSIEESEAILKQIDAVVRESGELLHLSSAVGSEAGVLSIGSGKGVDAIAVTATYVNRFERDRSIWEIAERIRNRLEQIPGIKQFDVVDYGATALASIRANVDITLSGDDPKKLTEAARSVEAAMYRTRGLVSVSRTWAEDKTVYDLDVDERLAAYYGIGRKELAQQLQPLIRGVGAATLPQTNAEDMTVWLQVHPGERASKETILTWQIETPKGAIPLSAVAGISERTEPSLITREGMHYTLNLYGFRQKAAISHIMASLEKNLADIELPEGVTLEQSGDIRQFEDSAARMIGAIGFAVVFIFLTLVVLFESVRLALIVVLSIPLTVIGASWMMLVMHYHVSMPAMMGFILLSGVIVNNAILLIHFARERMAAGLDATEAMTQSIKIRTRPVLMTALAVSAGMLPVAMGSAIGLERLAPLGTVAIGGLIVGTFLTLLYIPMIFIWAQTHRRKAS